MTLATNSGWSQTRKGAHTHTKAGVLTIEEYIERRRETIMKYIQMRNIYGKCKSSQKIDSNLLWLD
jgi:hypothetical protein